MLVVAESKPVGIAIDSAPVAAAVVLYIASLVHGPAVEEAACTSTKSVVTVLKAVLLYV